MLYWDGKGLRYSEQNGKIYGWDCRRWLGLLADLPCHHVQHIKMFIFLLVSGCLLPVLGLFLIIWSIPISHPGTSWNASWVEIKEAFGIMFHKRRFQAGLTCIVVGLLILWYILGE